MLVGAGWGWLQVTEALCSEVCRLQMQKVLFAPALTPELVKQRAVSLQQDGRSPGAEDPDLGSVPERSSQSLR